MANAPLKPCHGCGALLPADVAHFHRNADHYDGLETLCRACRCKRARERVARPRRRYAAPPMPTGPACLACGYPTRNRQCINCGIGYVKRVRAAQSV
jgi:hypothetical protein